MRDDRRPMHARSAGREGWPHTRVSPRLPSFSLELEMQKTKEEITSASKHTQTHITGGQQHASTNTGAVQPLSLPLLRMRGCERASDAHSSGYSSPDARSLAPSLSLSRSHTLGGTTRHSHTHTYSRVHTCPPAWADLPDQGNNRHVVTPCCWWLRWRSRRASEARERAHTRTCSLQSRCCNLSRRWSHVSLPFPSLPLLSSSSSIGSSETITRFRCPSLARRRDNEVRGFVLLRLSLRPPLLSWTSGSAPLPSGTEHVSATQSRCPDPSCDWTQL